MELLGERDFARVERRGHRDRADHGRLQVLRGALVGVVGDPLLVDFCRVSFLYFSPCSVVQNPFSGLRCGHARRFCYLPQPALFEEPQSPRNLARARPRSGRRRILENASDVAALRSLGLSAREILRGGEEEYTVLKLADPDNGDGGLFAAIARYPILLQRPIVVAGKRAVVARPPERVIELLGR